MKNNDDKNFNPKAYISLFSRPDDYYESAWVEPTGELVVTFSEEGVNRIYKLLLICRELLAEKNDPEFNLIRNDIDTCIMTLSDVKKEVYEQMKEELNV